jgi:hypothetical protein
MSLFKKSYIFTWEFHEKEKLQFVTDYIEIVLGCELWSNCIAIAPSRCALGE